MASHLFGFSRTSPKYVKAGHLGPMYWSKVPNFAGARILAAKPVTKHAKPTVTPHPVVTLQCMTLPERAGSVDKQDPWKCQENSTAPKDPPSLLSLRLYCGSVVRIFFPTLLPLIPGQETCWGKQFTLHLVLLGPRGTLLEESRSILGPRRYQLELVNLQLPWISWLTPCSLPFHDASYSRLFLSLSGSGWNKSTSVTREVIESRSLWCQKKALKRCRKHGIDTNINTW